MEARKFAVGDRIRLRLDSPANESPTDVYTISRMLPAVGNVWQYRVKRVDDGQERAVNEQQLTNAAPQTATQRPLADLQQHVQRIRNARASERTRVMARRQDSY